MKAVLALLRALRWFGIGCLTGLLILDLLVRVQKYPSERLAIERAASLTIVDREGRRLWQSEALAGQRRNWVPLSDIAPVLIDATLTTEDRNFYTHPGVDAWSILRAAWLNSRSLRLRYGASTLTMQLVRLLEPERDTRTVAGKLVQALHALELERSLDKSAIVEQYLNRAYYGNGAFGIEAAAELYFGTHASALSALEATFLAALPRAPHGYDPYRHAERARARARAILEQMRERDKLSADALRVALDAPLELAHVRPGIHARHFIDHLLNTLPLDKLGGGRLETSLDLRLQERLEVATRRHLDGIGGRNVTQAGIIVLDNRTGGILAMVGSADYADDDGSGALNITTTRRRPGSTLKPFVYALALERGDSPATLAYDVVLPGEAHETYTADVKQHGFARYRESLAGSYNLAAVHTLQKVGVTSLLQRLRQAGLTTLDGPDTRYGPDLAIGNTEIELIEYAGAFAAFGNAGVAIKPRSVVRFRPAADLRRITSSEASADAGNPFALSNSPLSPDLLIDAQAGSRVFSREVAYQIFDVLADPDARRPMFGSSAPMELPYPVALKTGTTRGYTDNLAFGTTREFTVGAWAGNFDGKPMQGVMAMQGAAPLVRAAFVALAALYGDPSAPERPGTLFNRDVCAVSGQIAGPHCPTRKRDWFTAQSARELERHGPCTFHADGDAEHPIAFPVELGNWARAHQLDDLTRARAAITSHRIDEAPDPAPSTARKPGLVIVYPPSGSRFVLDPDRPAKSQLPPLQTLPTSSDVSFTIDGIAARDFRPTPGRHVVRAQLGELFDESEIAFE